jgi:hypothetical protein
MDTEPGERTAPTRNGRSWFEHKCTIVEADLTLWKYCMEGQELY